ncbi:MAG: hypothetical protein ACLPX5_15910 [Dissulfurispiraceae bacterium]
MDCSKMARKLRNKIVVFSRALSVESSKVAGRFIAEIVYGIQASQSVVLTKVARLLEERIKVKKVEERSSRQLLRPGLGAKVQDNLLRLAPPLVGKDTLLILDPSEIQKKYAGKMQYLGKVRDGSEDEIGNGYWTCNVVAAELEGNTVVPLLGQLYSCESPEFVSENGEIVRV